MVNRNSIYVLNKKDPDIKKSVDELSEILYQNQK